MKKLLQIIFIFFFCDPEFLSSTSMVQEDYFFMSFEQINVLDVQCHFKYQYIIYSYNGTTVVDIVAHTIHEPKLMRNKLVSDLRKHNSFC